MTIDRWGSMTPSSSPRSQVAERTPCMPCKARGHHCNAYEIIGGRAVCIHCLDGVDCPKTSRNGVVDAPKRPVTVVVTKVPPASLQPALAPGAEPSAAMPARRVFFPAAASNGGPVKTRGKYKGDERARAKEMLASGMSLSATVAATGLSRNTVSSVRREMPGLPRASKGGPPRKAADMSAAAAEQVVAEAEAITAEVADEVERRSAGATEMGEMKMAAKPDELAKNKWTSAPEVMDPADMPGGRVSAYDGAVTKLRATPVGKVTRFPYATVALAETYRGGIAKRAHRAGLKMSSRLVGSDLYVWLREK